MHLKTYFAGFCSIYSFLADFGGRSKEIISSLSSKVASASTRFCGLGDLRPPPDVEVGVVQEVGLPKGVEEVGVPNPKVGRVVLGWPNENAMALKWQCLMSLVMRKDKGS